MRYHIETYSGQTLCNASAYESFEAAEDYLRKQVAEREASYHALLVRSVLDLDTSDRDPLELIAAMERLEARYVRRIVPCADGAHCMACYEAGFIEID